VRALPSSWRSLAFSVSSQAICFSCWKRRELPYSRVTGHVFFVGSAAQGHRSVDPGS
jgi:hypothetical protein